MQILDKAHSTVLLYLSFSSFNDMMTMIGLSRHCGGYPDLKVEYPAQCEDKQFYLDIVSLLYLYDPRRLGEANMVYAKFAKDPDGYATWVKEEFGLTASVCHNLHVPNMVEDWMFSGYGRPVLSERVNPERSTIFLPLSESSSDREIRPEDSWSSPSKRKKASKEAIKRFLKLNGVSKTAEIASAIGMGHSWTSELLKEMVADGDVVAQGEARARRYSANG